MADMDERRLDVIIALLARLVANASEGDEVVELHAAGLTPAEITEVLGMKSSAVSMRISRAKGKKK